MSYTLNQMTYEPTRMQTSGILQLKMISSNSFSSSSTTSSLSSGTDGKETRLCFDESKLYSTQHSLESEYPILNGNEISEKDERYWERRRKNNAAAKRSRERRRQHDIAMEQQIQSLKLSNAILQKELMVLKKRLSGQTSTIEKPELSPPIINQNQNYFPIEDISNLLINVPNLNLLSPNCLGLNNSTDQLAIPNSLPATTAQCFEEFYIQSNLSQNPLDLSLKVKNESPIICGVNNSNNKTPSRTSNLDQRYWDRRRRNNEAVRKCRQNKRAKMLFNATMINNNNSLCISNNIINNNNNSNNSNVDKGQIKTKIQSITNELEKLKSQLQNSEVEKSDLSLRCNVKTEEFVPNFPKRINFNEECKKILKWKNKLIEADQADKEILNQIRV